VSYVGDNVIFLFCHFGIEPAAMTVKQLGEEKECRACTWRKVQNPEKSERKEERDLRFELEDPGKTQDTMAKERH
jgi:hypothetical protein